MMFIFLQLGISVFGALSFILVTQEGRRAQELGVIYGLIAIPFWYGAAIYTEQWLTVPMHMLYTYGWVSKAVRLYHKRREYKEWTGSNIAVGDTTTNVS